MEWIAVEAKQGEQAADGLELIIQSQAWRSLQLGGLLSSASSVDLRVRWVLRLGSREWLPQRQAGQGEGHLGIGR